MVVADQEPAVTENEVTELTYDPRVGSAARESGVEVSTMIVTSTVVPSTTPKDESP